MGGATGAVLLDGVDGGVTTVIIELAELLDTSDCTLSVIMKVPGTVDRKEVTGPVGVLSVVFADGPGNVTVHWYETMGVYGEKLAVPSSTTNMFVAVVMEVGATTAVGAPSMTVKVWSHVRETLLAL